jgi:hypothetical protein
MHDRQGVFYACRSLSHHASQDSDVIGQDD